MIHVKGNGLPLAEILQCGLDTASDSSLLLIKDLDTLNTALGIRCSKEGRKEGKISSVDRSVGRAIGRV